MAAKQTSDRMMMPVSEPICNRDEGKELIQVWHFPRRFCVTRKHAILASWRVDPFNILPSESLDHYVFLSLCALYGLLY